MCVCESQLHQRYFHFENLFHRFSRNKNRDIFYLFTIIYIYSSEDIPNVWSSFKIYFIYLIFSIMCLFLYLLFFSTYYFYIYARTFCYLFYRFFDRCCIFRQSNLRVDALLVYYDLHIQPSVGFTLCTINILKRAGHSAQLLWPATRAFIRA